MQLYECVITLHEPLFYATREVGRLYETGRYLHNYALTYAFGFAVAPWFHHEQIPHYAADLAPLSQYVTPAEPQQVRFELTTFKYGEEQLHVEMKQAERNTPSFGRAKELAPGSTFRCYVLSRDEIPIPRWIRLGKWHSKASVEPRALTVKQNDGDYLAACPLNPLDLHATLLRAFDIISMPPTSLVANARCSGSHYVLENGYGIPFDLHYSFPKGTP